MNVYHYESKHPRNCCDCNDNSGKFWYWILVKHEGGNKINFFSIH